MESLLFVFKNLDLFLSLKKNDFDLSKYQICFVVFRKKVDFDNKNSNLFYDEITKRVFDNRKTRSVFYVF